MLPISGEIMNKRSSVALIAEISTKPDQRIFKLEERIIELEIKITNQENLLEQLNAVIYEQQKTLDQLVKAVKELEASNSLDIGPQNVKPPHY